MIAGKHIEGRDMFGHDIKGRVELVFDDAIVSGTSEYVTVTYLLVRGADDKASTIRPRDVSKIMD